MQAGEVLGSLSNDNPLEIVFAVPERRLARLAVGQPLRIEVASHPEEIFEGVIRFIEPLVDNVTRTATVVGDVPNPERRLRGGQFARVELMLARDDEAWLVPIEALRKAGDHEELFVIEGDQAVARAVVAGVRQGDERQVVSGLSGGELVVRNGQARLSRDEPTAVRVVELEDGRPR